MIVIALGANKSWLGQSPVNTIRLAIKAIHSLGQGVTVAPLYNAPAWPDPAEPAYVNTIVTLQTGLDPHAMLVALHAIEASFGRHRGYLEGTEARYAPRTLDLDLIDHHGMIIETDATDGADAGLVLPHPSLHLRDFVLLPLADIAPDWCHPVSGKTVQMLIETLGESISCEKR